MNKGQIFNHRVATPTNNVGVETILNVLIPVCQPLYFRRVFFFLFGDGTDGLTTGEKVQRFYQAAELGQLTYLPRGLVDHYL